MEVILNILKGMIIGISNIIPGVSGGTMAVVLGIYDNLISSINNLLKEWKKNCVFLGEIVIGAGLGIILFSKLITILLDKAPMQTNFFFIGLIVGTCPIIYKKATETKIKPINYLSFILAFGLLVAMAFIRTPGESVVIIREISTITFFKLAFGGFLAAAAMILPGVSGSFLLLVLGMYNTIVTAVSEMNILILIPVAIGVLLGLVTMTKIIDSFMKKYPQIAYLFIFGLVLGSIFSIYPGFSFGIVGVYSMIALIVGFIIAFLMGKK